MVPIEHFLYVSAFLFVIGLMVAMVKRNAIMVLIGIELMLNAANVNLVGFSQYDPVKFSGQVFGLFVMVVAAAEAAVALAIILTIYRHLGVSDIDKVSELKG